MLNLVLVHIGKTLPESFLDNIYQCLLTNYTNLKIYMVIDDDLILDLKNNVNNLNKIYFKNREFFDFHFEYIPGSIIRSWLNNNTAFKSYLKTLEKFESIGEFREGFWVSTTMRFFYIYALVKLFSLENVFHIENDVMLYTKLTHIKEYKPICKLIQDSPNRIIPSIMFFENYRIIESLVNFISIRLNESDVFINDMNLLNEWSELAMSLSNELGFIIRYYNTNPYVTSCWDAAAIGQYLDGVDVKNLGTFDEQQTQLFKWNNPSIHFENETALLKVSKFQIIKKMYYNESTKIPIKTLLINNQLINNLHIHSKQLYKFSSVLDISFNDIITGDRIISLCDFVLLTQEIFNYHINLDRFIKMDSIIMIKNFTTIDYKTLIEIFASCNKYIIKLHIYTHILDQLLQVNFFENLPQFKFIIYLHNSDHSFEEHHIQLLDLPCIYKVFAQNVNVKEKHSKLQLLPIGIANSMWPHGNLIDFYKVVSRKYLFQKTQNIYVNMNPNTFGYRNTLLQILTDNGYSISSNKNYPDYLKELSNYRFCLCPRGNAFESHRFWESLYLGVIPVIINNEDTNMSNFINYLDDLNIPYYSIINPKEFFECHDMSFFDDRLYCRILNEIQSSIQNLNVLKLSHYFDPS